MGIQVARCEHKVAYLELQNLKNVQGQLNIGKIC